VAELATALGELVREGIPTMLGATLWKARTEGLRKQANSVGGEYLNTQFGWLPLVSDIRDVSKGIVQFDKLISQYVRDAGRVVRRRYDFPPTETHSFTVTNSSASAKAIASRDATQWHDSFGLGKVERERHTSIRRWFSGAFTYHLPDDTGSGFVGHAESAIKLLGLDLDPEVLWNLTPWSWATDWYANTGDVLHNLSSWSADGLVMKYGYIMEHSIVRDTYRFMGPTSFKSPVYPQPVTLVTEVKLRRRASPFGFGISDGALSTRQKAIVAALGMSRA